MRTQGQWGDLFNWLLPAYGYFTDAPAGNWYARTQGQWGDLRNSLLPGWGYFTDAPGGSWFLRSAGQWGNINNFGFITDAPGGAWYLRSAGQWGEASGLVAAMGFATQGWVNDAIAGATGGGGDPGADGDYIVSMQLIWGSFHYPEPPSFSQILTSGYHEPYSRLSGWMLLIRTA